MPSHRTLKPGPRPFIAFGTVLGLFLLAALLIGIVRGRWEAAAQLAACMVAIFGFIGVFIASSRIVVDSRGITFRRGLSASQRVEFADITSSSPVILAERDWPIWLAIHVRKSESPALTLPLKPFRHADVTWLLSLPELRVKQR